MCTSQGKIQKKLTAKVKQSLAKVAASHQAESIAKKEAELAESMAKYNAQIAKEKAQLARSKELALYAARAYEQNPATSFRLAEASVTEQPNLLSKAQLWKFFSQVHGNMLCVLSFECAVVRLMNMYYDGRHFTQTQLF